jgi:hypothetical protein
VDILTEDQHRALAFIQACNNQGHAPTQDDVERWLTEPRQPMSTMQAFMSSAAIGFNSIFGRGAVTDQLVRLGWVYEADARSRLYISALGEALLRDAEEKAAEVVASTTVVLGSDNPLSYAALMSELAAAGAGLLIDPYIRREQLMHIVQDTKLARLLVSHKVGEKHIAAVRSFLAYVPDNRGLEVRLAAEAHDRYLMNEDGEIFIIGSSLNTVALRSATTVFTPVPEDSVDVFTKLIEDQWSAGEPLRPKVDEGQVSPDDDV